MSPPLSSPWKPVLLQQAHLTRRVAARDNLVIYRFRGNLQISLVERKTVLKGTVHPKN